MRHAERHRDILNRHKMPRRRISRYGGFPHGFNSNGRTGHTPSVVVQQLFV
jgi:hypothetical protein